MATWRCLSIIDGACDVQLCVSVEIATTAATAFKARSHVWETSIPHVPMDAERRAKRAKELAEKKKKLELLRRNAVSGSQKTPSTSSPVVPQQSVEAGHAK